MISIVPKHVALLSALQPLIASCAGGVRNTVYLERLAGTTWVSRCEFLFV